jgi:localization factor PodJL
MSTAAGPWSVKGIDPKARELAKDLARRQGMTLGEWLNQVIAEGAEGEPEPPPPPPYAERYSQQPVSSFDSFRRGRADSPAEVARVAAALDALAAKLEAAEHRSTLAITGIDQSVMGVLSRIEGVERDQTAVAARFDVALQDVRDAQSKLADKLRRMDEADAPRAEAMRALEAALGKVAGQLHESETRQRAGFNEVREDLQGVTRRVDRLDARLQGGADEFVERFAHRLELAEAKTEQAMKSLEQAFAGLDARLTSYEAAKGQEADPAERRFERLAMDLAEKVDLARKEMDERLKQAADGKLDRMEQALRNLADHVEAGERRQAQAVDTMGREVMKIAQTLGTRVQAVEGRSAQMVEQVGGEMARIAEAMEGRMRAADGAQAEALEKLGTEIARIAEKLADRIAGAERRSAQAIDDVGDQVARVTEKINARYERASTDLSERLRQSEERTLKMLEEARAKFGELGSIPAQSQPQSVGFDPFPAQPQSFGGPASEFGTAPEFSGEPTADALAAAEAPAPQPAAPADPFQGSAFDGPAFQGQGGFQAPSFEQPAFEAPSQAAFEDDPFAVSSGFPDGADAFAQPSSLAAASVASPAPAFQEAGPFAPPPAPDVAPPPAISPLPAEASFAPAPPHNPNRDLIEAARAAARQAASESGRGRRGRDVEAPAERGGAFSGFRLPKKKKAAGATVRTALLASGTAVTLTLLGVGGYLAAKGELSPRDVADGGADPVLSGAPAAAAPAQAAVALTEPASDLAASEQLVETTPPATVGTAPTAPVAPPAAPAAAKPADGSAKQLFSSAVSKLETGDNTGLDTLKRAANLGYAPAQFYMAKIYEGGTHGVKKDIVEARRWTERAAQGGDPKAMHNLGLYYFEGQGGEKNLTTAGSWFRKAADLGLQDSQYNLARLYEMGAGVAQNKAEAYKWYLISAASGDAESKDSAERMKKEVSAEAQLAAQRAAAAYRAQISGARVASAP